MDSGKQGKQGKWSEKNSLLDLTNYNKLFEMMSEHKISTAHKNQNAEKH